MSEFIEPSDNSEGSASAREITEFEMHQYLAAAGVEALVDLTVANKDGFSSSFFAVEPSVVLDAKFCDDVSRNEAYPRGTRFLLRRYIDATAIELMNLERMTDMLFNPDQPTEICMPVVPANDTERLGFVSAWSKI